MRNTEHSRSQPAARSPAHYTVWQWLQTIYNLGVKEFNSLGRDAALLVLIVFMFSGAIYSNAKAKPDAVNKAAIADVDEDRSQLSHRLIDALHEPYFLPPRLISRAENDSGMDASQDTFVLNIAAFLHRDIEAGRQPGIQTYVDATRISHALMCVAFIQTILGEEIQRLLSRISLTPQPVPVPLVQH